jgi:hypothetical protein
MNRFLTTLLISASVAAASAADSVESNIRFSNADQMSGTVESLTTEQLVWKSSILEKPAPFLLKNVLDLTLTPSPREVAGTHEAAITLTNGDLVRGQLASVTDESVELDTWFAGRMKFNRLMIRDVRISEHPDFIYRGPTGLDGWTQSADKPAWTYQNSAFRSIVPGGIARNVDLPDECSIAFDASWRNSFGLKLVFFSNDLTTDQPASGYEMTIQSRSVYLRSGKTQKFLGNTTNAVSLQENEKARIEVRASLKSGKICLFVDGEIIDVWTDPDAARNEGGKGIHFIAQNDSPVQVSRIEVGFWDGEVDQLPEPLVLGGLRHFGNQGIREMEDESEPAPPPEKKPDTGRMELRNGDSIAGKVVSIADDIITIQTPFREVKLPVGVLRSITLKPVDLERCKRENGDIRAWFPDGSSLVFRLDAVHGDKLTGFSQNFGTATFQIGAFNRIEFNIYDPALKDLRAANGW